MIRVIFAAIGLLLTLSPAPIQAADNGVSPCPTRTETPNDQLELSRSAPSTQLKLGSQAEIPEIGCKRSFTYRGETYPVDSYYKQDGEKLRPFIQSVPSSVEELNSYQRNMNNATIAAYTSGVGLLVMFTSLLMATRFDTGSATMWRAIGLYGGGGLLVGSLAYSVIVISANENHLTNAVDEYNKVNPEQRIELQVTTEIF